MTRVEPAGEGSAWKTSFTQCHCNSAGCRGERVFLEKFLKGRYDIILFDDMVKDGAVGKLSTLFDLRLFSRDGFAILLLNTVAGVHALRVGGAGKVTPVTVKWGEAKSRRGERGRG